jgi:hypothetical protein
MCLVALAQDPNNPAYLALDKFVGTWIYSKDGKEVKIVLQKVKKTFDVKRPPIFTIEGYHIYKIGSKNVENYQDRHKVSLTRGNLELRERPNLLIILVSDSIKNKTGEARLTFVPGNPDKLIWDLRSHRKGLIYVKKGDPPYGRTFTLPEVMTFEREQ